MFHPTKKILHAALLASCSAATPALATASIEFYNAGINHYFMTASADEATALDSKPEWGWARTGKTFNVWPTQASAPANTSPVCRFYGIFSNGTVGSHFYTVDATECAYVKSRLDWSWGYEGDAFHAVKPAGGACPSGTSPLYRVYNNGMGGAPNHRYMTSQTEVDAMVSQGWNNEGVAMCVQDAINGATTPQANYGDNSTDADGFLWGTEVWMDTNKMDSSYKNAVNDNLKTKYIKIRLGINNVSNDKINFSSSACFPSLKDCQSGKAVDLDEIARKFKANGWSMVPMLSYGYHGTGVPFSSPDIEDYVNFVDWFISRYKSDANIKYLELENCPNCNLSLTISNQLLVEATNRIYDRIKGKYPDISVGTPGFEYWIDKQDSMMQMLEYFLDKNNGAKFDFWAFHGYQLSSSTNNTLTTLPPTKPPSYNKYAGVIGALEIRTMLDANGWQNRPMIDTENGTIFPGMPYTTEEENTDTAYLVQEALLKRTLKTGSNFVLAGKLSLKTRTRENIPGVVGDATAGNLNSDGSLARPYKAVSFLLSKFNEYNHSSHLSGEWGAENIPWIEKFTSGADKELYIFFKPFKYVPGMSISSGNETLGFTLNLNKTPKSVVLFDAEGNTSNVTATINPTIQAVNSPQYLEVSY